MLEDDTILVWLVSRSVLRGKPAKNLLYTRYLSRASRFTVEYIVTRPPPGLVDRNERDLLGRSTGKLMAESLQTRGGL